MTVSLTPVLTVVCGHPYSRRMPEVGMMGCGYGCKIERCDACGTDAPSHRAVYGCRNTAPGLGSPRRTVYRIDLTSREV